MDGFLVAFIVVIVVAARLWRLPGRLTALQKELAQRLADQQKLYDELQRLQAQVNRLTETTARPAEPLAVVRPTAPNVAAPAVAAPAPPAALPVVPPVVRPEPVLPPPPVAPSPAPLSPAPVTVPPAPKPIPTPEPAPLPIAASVAAAKPAVPAAAPPLPILPPVAMPTPASRPVALPRPVPLPVAAAVMVTPPPVVVPPRVPPMAPPPPATPRRPPPPPVPTGPSWWERASTVLLENWTGILGAVVLVTGVGFLGIYAALRLAPPFRFLMICAFAAGLLGVRFALRDKAFARQLNGWLLSSAAAIFLFACVASASIPGLQWATPPFDYLLLLAGVSANLWLAWRASRQEVATLHGVLSLVALAVLPPTGLTLGAAAGVTAFSIAITYRQQWKYQLLLSIASFFAFHLYWHQQLAIISGPLRLVAMGLVLLVGVAAAVVQYRSVYAKRTFEPLLFTAHLLNWTCMGINLYLYSTGSIWKTIPLALGALLTFWAGRRAKQLGIGWLFQTDTIIALMLALATAFSLQGWHATNSVILLFMLLEALLVALIMARQREALVYRVAMSGTYLAGAGLLLLAGSKLATSAPATLYRDALVLALAGWAGMAFVRFIFKQALLLDEAGKPAGRQQYIAPAEKHRNLLGGFAGVAGLLQAGAGVLLARVLFASPNAPVWLLLGALLGLAGVALGLAAWLRGTGRTPEWVRQQQLLLAQGLVLLAGFGLHELGLRWPVVLGLLYAENLLAALLAARQREALLARVALAGAFLAGVSGLLVAVAKMPDGPAGELYRDALVLALAGWAGIVFVPLMHRLLVASPALAEPAGNRAGAGSPKPAGREWLNGFAGLAGLLQAGAGLLLARVLFAWPHPPVWLLLGALLGLAAAALGLAAWLHRTNRTPEWIRQQQLLLAQGFALLAGFGLHELKLSWPVVLGLLFAENLVVALLAARRREALLYRVALSVAYAAGSSLALVAAGQVEAGLPAKLCRDALVLALTGWAGLAFVQRGFRLFHRHAADHAAVASAAGTSPIAAPFVAADITWLGGLGGLAGLLQAGAGLVLARVLFAWQDAPVWVLLGCLLALGATALGLAAWLRASPPVPAWMRRQQLVLGQFFATLALLGLHETGLSWPVVVGLLYAENLTVALFTAQRRETLLYHLTLASAYLTGAALLLFAGNAVGSGRPAILYRDALVLALAGWGGILFTQWARHQFRRATSGQALDQSESSPTEQDLLSGFAGLAGVLQAGAGAVLARVLFAWQEAPAGLLLLALLGLAGAALGLAAWVRSQAVSPSWVRRQQLVLGQFFVVLAVFGLHETGLSWPGVFFILYAENLLVALLLNGRDEDTLLHVQTYLLVLQAAVLPLLVRYSAPDTLGLRSRAALLAGAALLTAGYQIRPRFLPKAGRELAVIQLSSALLISALGLGAGWLLLSAGALVYDQAWTAWTMVALLGSLLLLRQRVAAPGLWAGLVLAAVGYLALQWGHVLAPPPGVVFSPGYVLLYLLPTLAVPVVGVRASWWSAAGRFVRWPWLYLLALHLVVALVAAVPSGHIAYLAGGLLGLAGLAFAAAQRWRSRLPNEAAVLRAGQPDRFLLHLGYVLLGAGLAIHLSLLALDETFFGQPAEYFTAALVFGIVAGVAIMRPPATAPVYNSWRLIQPWLPEAALLFGTATLWHNVRTPWLALVWVLAALVLGYGAAQIPVRLRRLGVYGRLYYWLAAGTASVASLLYLEPSQILTPAWWEITAAVGLLFGYVWQSLAGNPAPFAGLSPAWDLLARPPRRLLEAWLLYPAFLALALLFIQSFDRSVLTVLLMLEVVAIFSTSLLLRRQDLRYLSLAGMLACLVRLVFFDLSRSGTVTRAVVFIFMGLLLLGMNALYARFKTRFMPDEPTDATPD